MSKLLLQLGITLSLFTVAICIRNKEIIKWWFVNPSITYAITDGKIIESNISHTGVHGGWKFNISYEYFVEDTQYRSNIVHYGYQTSSDKSYAEGYITKYPIEKTVVVYFDPNNPSLSVLEPEVKWFGLAYYIGFFTILSFTLLFLSRKYKIKEQVFKS